MMSRLMVLYKSAKDGSPIRQLPLERNALLDRRVASGCA